MTDQLRNLVGVVAIGRNEGTRLERCLDSVIGKVAGVVYVDSGSTDGSVQMARDRGAEVVELDLSTPFTAARARNAGVQRLVEQHPGITYVQVVDGDCELVDGWLEVAFNTMQTQPDIAVACGRRRERDIEFSVYNRITDMEWNTPPGEAEACGGDALIRLSAFQQVDGYDESLIAGEEPEMCLRMRRNGHRVLRIDHEMTLHDAMISRFDQWWKRCVRCGYAYAEGHVMHGGSPDRYCVKEVRSDAMWVIVLPLIALGAAWFTWGISLLLVPLGYGVLWWRVRRWRRRRGDGGSDASLHGLSVVVGKFAEMQGMIRYWLGRMRGSKSAIIEYKAAGAVAPVTSGEAVES
jgi:glycosyltransferase involved in cell wall biosynthesis